MSNRKFCNINLTSFFICCSFFCVLRFCVWDFVIGYVHHTKCTKSTQKHEKEKKPLDGLHVVPSPVPHTKLSKINEMHEKGDRGGGEEFFCIQKTVSVLEFISFKMTRCFLFLH